MSSPASYLAFVGTFTDGDAVYTYRVDADTGATERLAASDAGESPSYLALHPGGTHLYAVNHVEDGTVVALEIDRETGALSRLNRRSTGGGASPCYCSVDATGSYVLIAHYRGGRVSMVPIEADGRVGDPTAVVDHHGSGPDPDRQTGPHPHSIVPGPDNRYVYVPDLGADRIVVYELDLDEGTLRPADPPAVTLHGGAGPRHLEFHPDGRFAYVINELDSTLTALERDPETGALTAIDTASTLPPEFEGENLGADVHVHPSGRWVYGSNRGHDSVAIFAIEDDGRPRPVAHEPTRGAKPRVFALDPPGAHLFAANQDDDELVVFRIDGETGEPTATGHVAEVPRPTCVKFLRT